MFPALAANQIFVGDKTKIGLDYGGVISFSPDGWANTVRFAMMDLFSK